jgi:uncharacterized membrane protein
MKETPVTEEAAATAEAPEPAPPATEKPEKKEASLPIILTISIVGAALFLVGSFLTYYDGIPNQTPRLFDAMSGKVAVILILLSVLLVAIKRFQILGLLFTSLALGAVLQSVIDTNTGDSLVVKLANTISATEEGGAALGMYAALFGALICFVAVVLIPKKKKDEDK